MKNKKIMIIGGTGALGKTLIKRYNEENNILVFSRDKGMPRNQLVMPGMRVTLV